MWNGSPRPSDMPDLLAHLRRDRQRQIAGRIVGREVEQREDDEADDEQCRHREHQAPERVVEHDDRTRGRRGQPRGFASVHSPAKAGSPHGSTVAEMRADRTGLLLARVQSAAFQSSRVPGDSSGRRPASSDFAETSATVDERQMRALIGQHVVHLDGERRALLERGGLAHLLGQRVIFRRSR